jgi:parvulin-like peptidyl-prolyl isomerase
MALAFLRRHRRWFFVFLWVVILAFVILYIPNTDPATSLANTTVATVGGQAIQANEFQRVYLRQRRQFLDMNQGQIDEAMLERMGLREQVLSSMVRARLEALEADRLGFQVDDKALVKAITDDPQLQMDGRFIGTATLTRMLQSRGMTVVDFENEVRAQLKAQRLREAVTDRHCFDVNSAEFVAGRAGPRRAVHLPGLLRSRHSADRRRDIRAFRNRLPLA